MSDWFPFVEGLGAGIGLGISLGIWLSRRTVRILTAHVELLQDVVHAHSMVIHHEKSPGESQTPGPE